MKGDTISRSALLRKIEKWLDRYNGDLVKRLCFAKAKDIVENAPTVNAEPVVHAQWIEEFDENGVSWGTYYCSICHGGPGNDSDGKPWLSANCPNCGARMDAEEGAGE